MNNQHHIIIQQAAYVIIVTIMLHADDELIRAGGKRYVVNMFGLRQTRRQKQRFSMTPWFSHLLESPRNQTMP